MACSGEECRTCDGRCCALFTYPLDDVVARYAADTPLDDDLMLLEMLRPLTHDEAKERAERFGVEASMGEVNPALEFYTCRHWDEDTRLCTAYDTRPRMCRCYPYGKGCNHGCDYEVSDDYLVEEGWITPKAWFKKSYV